MKTGVALVPQEGCEAMTYAEMDGVIKDYCGGVDCKDCVVKEICDSITGRFTENKDAIKKAYEILTQPDTKEDAVNHPKHYETGKFECIDVMVETQGKEAVKAFCLCNAFKYLYRHKSKNGLEDIKKARWYLDKYLELEGESIEGLPCSELITAKNF